MSASGPSSEPTLIVIDGPAGAGKTTVARRVAAHFGYALLDTGAIYRALAVFAEQAGVDWDDGEALTQLVQRMPLRFAPGEQQGVQQVWLGTDNVTQAIRTAHISEGASRVSVHAGVRAALLGVQQRLAQASGKGCVAEGRDMGTVVFPHAPYKFFLTADDSTRVHRRHRELVERDAAAAPSLGSVAVEMARRDERDSQRAVAPLVRADDAVLVDSSGRGIDDVVSVIIQSIESVD